MIDANIRALLVDDDSIVRNGVRMMLNVGADIKLPQAAGFD
jgi:hypothetical protein